VALLPRHRSKNGRAARSRSIIVILAFLLELFVTSEIVEKTLREGAQDCKEGHVSIDTALCSHQLVAPIGLNLHPLLRMLYLFLRMATFKRTSLVAPKTIGLSKGEGLHRGQWPWNYTTEASRK
jgi:hypothetical protein